MGAYLLKRDQGKEHADPKWMKPFLAALNWCLSSSTDPALAADRAAGRGSWMRRRVFYRLKDHRLWVMGMGLAFFVGSLALASTLPGEFIPAEDISRSSATVELAPGTTLEQTDEAVRQVTEILRARPEVDSVFSSIGSATVSFGPGGGGGQRRCGGRT